VDESADVWTETEVHIPNTSQQPDSMSRLITTIDTLNNIILQSITKPSKARQIKIAHEFPSALAIALENSRWKAGLNPARKDRA
jgi:hypothetical protein